MQPRRKLVGTFQGYLHEYDEDGNEHVTEINTDLNNVTTDYTATWFSRGAVILGISDWGIIVSDVFINGLAGRMVKLDVPVDDALERIYALPSQPNALKFGD